MMAANITICEAQRNFANLFSFNFFKNFHCIQDLQMPAILNLVLKDRPVGKEGDIAPQHLTPAHPPDNNLNGPERK